MNPSSKNKILRAIKLYPRHGAPNWRLAGITLRYGARIKDLREEGYNIVTIRETPGTFRYVLRGEV